MRVLVSPDTFKGSLDAIEVSRAIETGLKRFDPTLEAIQFPLADGGEGTLSVLESVLNLERVELAVHDPLLRLTKAYYLRSQDTAYIEMAQASGFGLLEPHERSAKQTSTFGTGELILDALLKKAKTIYLLVGGSATNDAGCGMAEALGYRFLRSGQTITELCGQKLSEISEITAPSTNLLEGIEVHVLTDVQNPLYGEKGAAYVFGPQKGANTEDVILLDNGLRNIAQLLNNGNEHVPGSGAAGGMGYGALSFLNGSLQSGIEAILNMTNYADLLTSVDLVITGEGRLDEQTLHGKVVSGVYNKAVGAGLPLGIICGSADPNVLSQFQSVKSIRQIADIASSQEDAMKNAVLYIEQLAFEMAQRVFLQ